MFDLENAKAMLEDAMYDEANDWVSDVLYPEVVDKAYAIVEENGYTDVFTEPSVQGGHGGDFFWATKDGVRYSGSYDYECECEGFLDIVAESETAEEAIEKAARWYANLIMEHLEVGDDDEDDD